MMLFISFDDYIQLLCLYRLQTAAEALRPRGGCRMHQSRMSPPDHHALRVLPDLRDKSHRRPSTTRLVQVNLPFGNITIP